MRTLALGLGLLLSSSVAFAATPKGNGNFRRAEVMKAAGAKQGRVMGLVTTHQAKNFKSSRVLAVSSGNKVTLVKAPTNKGQRVRVMTQREAHQMGLITQSEAAKLARSNGGLM